MSETVEELKSKIAHLEAKIDTLMLEFCPEEMTDEQIENWAKHQVLSDVRSKNMENAS